MDKIYNHELPFYKMNLQELKTYFIKNGQGLERKVKTKRKYRSRNRKTAKKIYEFL